MCESFVLAVGFVGHYIRRHHMPHPHPGLAAITNGSKRAAVDAWVSNRTAAAATYGHIKFWDTQYVTDMSYLFCGEPNFPQCTATAQKQSYSWDDLSHW